MLIDKTSYIANFNLTFGTENLPMLTQFENIIFPAFTREKDELKRKKNKNTNYFFEQVKLTNVNGDFVLAGLIVKSTKLEVKSRIIDGKLVRTDEVYPSDPYSYFLINLKNHRMVLVKNQNGSPTLKNFSATARDILFNYIREQNSLIENKDDKLPLPSLNVVAIPFEGTIEEQLKGVKKINSITLKFYPRNGDIMENETVDELTETLIALGSKTGYLRFNSPQNKESVSKVVKDTKGLLQPSLKVQFKNGTSGTLKDDSLTEVMSIPIDEEETFLQNIDVIAGKVINKEEFIETSPENKSIYDRFYTKIEGLYNKLIKWLNLYKGDYDMNNQKLFDNTQKLVELKKLKSFDLFLLSLKLFSLGKTRIKILGVLFVIFLLTQKFLMYPKVQAISIISDLTVNLNTIMIPVFAVVITGYAIFQALSNGSTLIRLISINHQDNIDKFSTYNLYFYGLSIFYLGIIILNFVLLAIFKYLPKNWYVSFLSVTVNEYIAAILISLYLVLNLYFLIEIKSFIYNLFQIFTTNATSASIEHLSDKENKN